jgi:hypothetical protein
VFSLPFLILQEYFNSAAAVANMDEEECASTHTSPDVPLLPVCKSAKLPVEITQDVANFHLE